jgi:hypothetical protein
MILLLLIILVMILLQITYIRNNYRQYISFGKGTQKLVDSHYNEVKGDINLVRCFGFLWVLSKRFSKYFNLSFLE